MKIAIDESGDNGRKFWRGSSKFFVLSAVIVPDDLTCGPTCQSVAKYRKEHNFGREIHFVRNSHQQHIDFLKYIHPEEFLFVSVCIDKRKLVRRRPYVFRQKLTFLKYSFEQLFNELKPWLDSPVVLVDTNGPKHFNRALNRHLLRLYGSHHKGDKSAIKQIRAVDSSSEPLVQLADYVSGAVRHHIDGEHPKSNTYELYLKDKGKIFYV